MNYEIVGIYNSGFQELDEKFCIADLRHIQRLNKWEADQIGSFEVFIDDFSQIEEKTVEVYKAIPSLMNADLLLENIILFLSGLKFLITIPMALLPL